MDTPAADFLITRLLHGPRALVWRAWTEPGLLSRWFGPHALAACDCQLELRVGGQHHVRMRMPDGVLYPIRGEYRDIQAMERLVMTMDCREHPRAWHDLVRPNRAPGDDNGPGIMLQTVTFEDADGRTRLSIHTRFADTARRDAMVALGMYQGWSESLEKLDTLVVDLAGPAAPQPARPASRAARKRYATARRCARAIPRECNDRPAAARR